MHVLSRFKSALRHSSILLGVILCIALVFRVWGISFGLPLGVHPDEHSIYVAAVQIASRGDFNPHFFSWPAHTVIYIDALLFFLVTRIFDFFTYSSFTPQTLAQVNLPFILIIGRLVTIGFALVGIFFTYKIGCKEFNKKTGLLAAFLLSILPLHVIHSHYITADVALTTFLTIAFYFLLLFTLHHRMRYLVIASLVTGLSLATKYPGALFLLIIYLAIISSAWFRMLTLKRKLLFLCLPLAITAVTVAFSAPYLILDIKSVIATLHVEARSYHLGLQSKNVVEKIMWYITSPLQNEAGTVFTLFSFCGIVLLLTRRKLSLFLVALFPLFYLFAISNLGLYWDRWIVPITPFLALPAASLFFSLINRFNPLLQKMLIAVFVLFVVLPPFARSIVQDKKFTIPDTRQLELAWWKSKKLDPSQKNYSFIAADSYSAAGTKKRFGSLFTYASCSSVQKTYKYVVISSGYYGRILNNQTRYPKEAACYKVFLKKKPLVVFSGKHSQFPNTSDDRTLFLTMNLIPNIFAPRIANGPRIVIYPQSINPNDTSHWKVFVNKKYRYSLKYPSNVIIKSGNSGLIMATPTQIASASGKIKQKSNPGYFSIEAQDKSRTCRMAGTTITESTNIGLPLFAQKRLQENSVGVVKVHGTIPMPQRVSFDNQVAYQFSVSGMWKENCTSTQFSGVQMVTIMQHAGIFYIIRYSKSNLTFQKMASTVIFK